MHTMHQLRQARALLPRHGQVADGYRGRQRGEVELRAAVTRPVRRRPPALRGIVRSVSAPFVTVTAPAKVLLVEQVLQETRAHSAVDLLLLWKNKWVYIDIYHVKYHKLTNLFVRKYQGPNFARLKGTPG